MAGIVMIPVILVGAGIGTTINAALSWANVSFGYRVSVDIFVLAGGMMGLEKNWFRHGENSFITMAVYAVVCVAGTTSLFHDMVTHTIMWGAWQLFTAAVHRAQAE